MDTMVISEFKAKCIGVMKKVARTRNPVTVTLRGKPLAIVKSLPREAKVRKLGTMKGAMKIKGDIISGFTEDWDMSR